MQHLIIFFTSSLHRTLPASKALYDDDGSERLIACDSRLCFDIPAVSGSIPGNFYSHLILSEASRHTFLHSRSFFGEATGLLKRSTYPSPLNGENTSQPNEFHESKQLWHRFGNREVWSDDGEAFFVEPKIRCATYF